MPSIRDRLAKLPPFDEDIPMIAEVKKIAQQQTSAPQIKEEEPQEVPQEDILEESEVPEGEVKQEPVMEVEPPKEEIPEEPKQEVSERTAEQIDKLKEHNKQLKEENQTLYKNVMESLRPEPLPPMQELTPQVMQQVDRHTTELPQTKVDDIYANLIDKDGYIDPDLLIRTLREANESAKQARIEAEDAKREAREARQETKRTKQDFEEDKDVRKVHKKYPQIDPKNEDFNEFFWDDVRKEIATAPILKGTTPTFMEAADAIWEARYKPKEVEEVNKKEKEKMIETENKKKQINATAPAGRPDEFYAKSDEEALKQATIFGKKGALAERLRRAGQ